MLHLGLLGRNIQHSKSPEIYKKLLSKKFEYKLFDISEESQIPELSILLQNLDGLSITAPYKKHFLNMVELTDEIATLNSINCIKMSKNGPMATNTDFLAIKNLYPKILKQFGPFKSHIILGDGSMAWITEVFLNNNLIPYKIFSRKNCSNFFNLNLKSVCENEKTLIINSCSRDFVFSGILPEKFVFWDYNYSMAEHSSLVKDSNGVYIDGIELLENQAIYAIQFWGI